MSEKVKKCEGCDEELNLYIYEMCKVCVQQYCKVCVPVFQCVNNNIGKQFFVDVCGNCLLKLMNDDSNDNNIHLLLSLTDVKKLISFQNKK